MAIPLYNGVQAFGLFAEFISMPNPPRVQLDSYPGLNGRTLLRLGTDGGKSVCRCLLYGDTESDLATVENVWMSWMGQAVVYSLRDTLGRVWPNVMVAQFEPLEGPKPCDLGVSRLVQITFEHLT